jgi:hypothetical protein
MYHTYSESANSVIQTHLGSVMDAYYMLSDPQRRNDYDRLSSSKSSSERPKCLKQRFPHVLRHVLQLNSAAGNGPPGAVPSRATPDQRPNADQVSGDVFDLPPYFTLLRNDGSPLFFFSFLFPPSFYGQTRRLNGISCCGPG